MFDPVLACVGVENSRLRAIRERLGGEVCQILVWSDVREDMVAEALFPAAVHRGEQAEEDDADGRQLNVSFAPYCDRSQCQCDAMEKLAVVSTATVCHHAVSSDADRRCC